MGRASLRTQEAKYGRKGAVCHQLFCAFGQVYAYVNLRKLRRRPLAFSQEQRGYRSERSLFGGKLGELERDLLNRGDRIGWQGFRL